MPRNGPQPGEGESERHYRHRPTPPKTNPRPWLSQRGVSRNETFLLTRCSPRCCSTFAEMRTTPLQRAQGPGPQ